MSDEKQAAECDKKCAVCPPAKMIAASESNSPVLTNG